MRVISWNTNRRRRMVSSQVEALLSRTPDIVALQEVTPGTVAMLTEGLRSGGLVHVRSTVEEGVTRPLTGPRAYGVLVASRYPLEAHSSGVQAPWAEKAISAVVEMPLGPLDLHTVHVPPGSSHGWVKVEVLEAVYEHLARPVARPCLLSGDFNTPRAELPSGEVVTWAQRMDATGRVRARRVVRGGPADRWDAAERNILVGLAGFGLQDVFRSLHGYGVERASWVLRNRRGTFARRFDHLFASAHLCPTRCEYLQEWREAGWSDHAAIEADLEVR